MCYIITNHVCIIMHMHIVFQIIDNYFGTLMLAYYYFYHCILETKEIDYNRDNI